MFDKKLKAAPNYKFSVFKRMKNWVTRSRVDTVEKIKDKSFGRSFFIMPYAPNFYNTIICMANDGSRLAHKITLKKIDFESCRGVQYGCVLYMFFFGSPVTVSKISSFRIKSSLKSKPLITKLPSMQLE